MNKLQIGMLIILGVIISLGVPFSISYFILSYVMINSNVIMITSGIITTIINFFLYLITLES